MKRMTQQRKAILKVMEEQNRPLFIEEILTHAMQEIPRINLSTIYRNIKILLEEKKVTLVELHGGKVCYEIVNNAHRHYFLCDGCSKIFPIKGCPKGLADMIPSGFQLMGHAISLNGFCLECHV